MPIPNSREYSEFVKLISEDIRQYALKKMLKAFQQSKQHPLQVQQELMLLALIDVVDEEMDRHRCEFCGNTKLVLPSAWHYWSGLFNCHCPK